MQKHIHFIGIAGIAIAPIAKLMKSLGWKVTGFDHNEVWEPMRSFLKNNEIEYYEKTPRPEMIKDADLIVIGGSVLMGDQNNPEFVEAQRLKKKIVGYAQLLSDFVIKEKSIVVAGTYGKTTVSALLAWILECADLNPSFMTGGQSLNFPDGVRATDSQYSVMEGDEYVSVWGYDMEPRFVYYKPKFSLITSAKWDHLNVYPTEDSYIDAFKKLIVLTKENSGELLLNADGENLDKVKKGFPGKVYTYALNRGGKKHVVKGSVDYTGEIVANTLDKTVFVVYEGTELLWEFETKMFGEHNIENCVGAIAMARILGIEVDAIDKALKSFMGVKRRQEIIGRLENGASVMDDLAHSPIKVRATLEAIRTRYDKNKVIAVFDPHASSLSDPKTLKWYKGVFDKADFVIIPKVSVKKSTPKEMRVYGKDIAEAIAKTQPNVEYIPLEADMFKRILNLTDSNSLVVFMSSGGWNGLIQRIIKDGVKV